MININLRIISIMPKTNSKGEISADRYSPVELN